MESVKFKVEILAILGHNVGVEIYVDGVPYVAHLVHAESLKKNIKTKAE